jgi:hypothetical protein
MKAIAACLSILALGAASSASAAPLRFVADTCSEVCSRDEDVVPVSSEVIGSNTTGYLYGETHWVVQAAADLGALRAYAHGESIPFPQIPSNQLPPAIGGIVIAFVTDYITFVLPPGPQTVPVTFELAVSGSCTGTDGMNFNGTFRSNCSGGGSLLFPGVQLGLNETGSTSTVRTFEFLPTDPTGPFELTYRLDIQAQATNGFFTGDFSHTVIPRISTTAPGVTIVSQSGYDYGNPVPVPAAAWLTVPMLAVLGPWVRRKRVSRAA